jgi:hypothetical protein
VEKGEPVAKREITKEVSLLDEAFEDLWEARLKFARAIMAADVEAEEGEAING